MSRLGWTASVLLGVALGGYAVADIYDVAPGVLTLDRPAPPPASAPSLVPLPTPGPKPTARPLGAAPSGRGLATALMPGLDDPALGRTSAVVTDDKGTVLWAKDARAPRTPASLLKLTSALAIASTVTLDDPLRTEVRARNVSGSVASGGAGSGGAASGGAASGEVVLLSGGDTLIARGKGNRAAVLGRAGLADLAAQTADALRAAGRTRVVIGLDPGPGDGPLYPRGWLMTDVEIGVTQGVASIGLADQRAKPGAPILVDPKTEVLSAFVTALRARGIVATPGRIGRFDDLIATPVAAVEGASWGEQLSYALDHSDNALTEALVRQASALVAEPAPENPDPDAPAHPADQPPARPTAREFITAALTKYGVSTKGLVINDASGLGPGQQASAQTISDVITVALRGRVPGFVGVIADLPVAGLDGTLAQRFRGATTKGVAGIPRAKTGTLRGVGGLAGTTVDANGRLLGFVVMSDRGAAGIDDTRAALDRVVAALTRCGCR